MKGTIIISGKSGSGKDMMAQFMKEELAKHSEIETVYIIDDSEENYRALAAQINVKNTYQLYRDYLDNFKINIERR